MKEKLNPKKDLTLIYNDSDVTLLVNTFENFKETCYTEDEVFPIFSVF